jgi:hypothetical protein
VVTPDLHGAEGRGSSRLFSERNYLEFAIALRLRAASLPVAAVSGVLRVLRAFEATLREELSGFSLTHSLRQKEAPDVRIIVSDGETIFFSLTGSSRATKLFGGIELSQITGDNPASISITAARRARPQSGNGASGDKFGGPEGSRFTRFELSVTQTARSLPLE